MSDACLVRVSALVHDLGKGFTPPSKWPRHIGHEKRGLPLLAQLCERLAVPKEHGELARLATEFHTHCHRAQELKPSTVPKLLKSTDAFRRPERLEESSVCCGAEGQGRT